MNLKLASWHASNLSRNHRIYPRGWPKILRQGHKLGTIWYKLKTASKVFTDELEKVKHDLELWVIFGESIHIQC